MSSHQWNIYGWRQSLSRAPQLYIYIYITFQSMNSKAIAMFSLIIRSVQILCVLWYIYLVYFQICMNRLRLPKREMYVRNATTSLKRKVVRFLMFDGLIGRIRSLCVAQVFAICMYAFIMCHSSRCAHSECVDRNPLGG